MSDLGGWQFGRYRLPLQRKVALLLAPMDRCRDRDWLRRACSGTSRIGSRAISGFSANRAGTRPCAGVVSCHRCQDRFAAEYGHSLRTTSPERSIAFRQQAVLDILTDVISMPLIVGSGKPFACCRTGNTTSRQLPDWRPFVQIPGIDTFGTDPAIGQSRRRSSSSRMSRRGAVEVRRVSAMSLA